MVSQQPVLPHIVIKPYKGVNLKAHHFTKDWKQNIKVAYAYLEKASKRMKKWANKRCRDIEFKIEDLVLVKLNPKQFRSIKSRDRRLV